MRAAYPIYTDAAGRRAVRGDDPDARVLLVPAGHDIRPAVARRFGLVDGRIPEPEPEPEPARPKKRTRKQTGRT